MKKYQGLKPPPTNKLKNPMQRVKNQKKQHAKILKQSGVCEPRSAISYKGKI